MTYLEPFIFFDNPAGHHVVMRVILGRAQVNLVPAIRLERLLEYCGEFVGHLDGRRRGLLNLGCSRWCCSPRRSKHAKI